MWCSRPATLPQAEVSGFLRCHDEPRTEQLDAASADVAVGLQGLRACYVRCRWSSRQDAPSTFSQGYLRCVVVARPLADHLLQHPRSLAGRAHRHRDPHRRALGAVHPGMVGDGEDAGDRSDCQPARARWCSSTRRLKVWRRLLVVIRPKRRARPVRTSSAALSHQNIT